MLLDEAKDFFGRHLFLFTCFVDLPKGASGHGDNVPRGEKALCVSGKLLEFRLRLISVGGPVAGDDKQPLFPPLSEIEIRNGIPLFPLLVQVRHVVDDNKSEFSVHSRYLYDAVNARTGWNGYDVYAKIL